MVAFSYAMFQGICWIVPLSLTATLTNSTEIFRRQAKECEFRARPITNSYGMLKSASKKLMVVVIMVQCSVSKMTRGRLSSTYMCTRVQCKPHTIKHYFWVFPWQPQGPTTLMGIEPWSLVKNSLFLIYGSNAFLLHRANDHYIIKSTKKCIAPMIYKSIVM